MKTITASEMKRATPEFSPQGPPSVETPCYEGNDGMSLQQNSSNRNPPLPDSFDSDRLVSPEVAAELMGLSLATLRRMWSDGEGPRKIRISKRRIGVRLRDLAEYLDRAAV
jgi:predicted DNA-binding transcriptional regulator AlpA